jgi:hypothetical protein
MGQSSLLGLDSTPGDAEGRDTAALGPSDSSDSGSDLVGVEDYDVDDPSQPVDIALRDGAQHALSPGDALDGASSDSTGTGERRSAGSDAGGREAADISVDRIIDPFAADEDGDGEEVDEDEDPDLAFVDDAVAEDPLSDEFTDEVGGTTADGESR